MKRSPEAKSKPRPETGGSSPHHTQKMQVFSELAGGVAHDFNNLLTIFQGYTELLQMEMDPNDARQGYLKEMAEAVERARTLTTQLLNISRKKRSEPEIIRMGAVLLDYQKMLRRVIPENIEVVLGVEENTGWVMADPREIETLLINLAVNACEAMPKGGRLAIELTETAKQVQMTITDSGIGMENTLLSRIFEPGFTTKTTGNAAGHGLAVCSEIVEQSGGQITVQSAPGKGSSFKVSLPRIEPPALDEAALGVSTLHGVPSGKGKKVLIVEDDTPVQKALASMLRGLGYQALFAANGDEALRILKKESEIRLVITDLVMPLMGGIELAEAIRQRWPGIQMILTSGYTFESPANSAETQQPIIFLPKPIPYSILAKTLCELLNA